MKGKKWFGKKHSWYQILNLGYKYETYELYEEANMNTLRSIYKESF